MPVTRNGVAAVPAEALMATKQPSFGHLLVRSTAVGAGHQVSGKMLCGLVPAAAFLDGRIKPHENTLTARLNRQKELVTAERGALGKPILLTAADLTSAWAAVDQQEMTSDQLVRFSGHNDYTLINLTAREEQGLCPISLDGLGTLVIADGHHRAETHALLSAEGHAYCDYVPVCIADVRDLTIGCFRRQLPAYVGTIDDLLKSLRPYFRIHQLAYPVAPELQGNWLMSYQGKYFELSRDKVDARYTTQLGWLTGEVLANVFGILDPKNDDRLVNLEVDTLPSGLLDIDGDRALSFTGSSVSPQAFFSEVAAGRVFPPKSTRFLPRVPSGLLVWPGWRG
ncbi:DUF1015 family protein [Lewinella sp. 4G2]|uniref:DUF1015 family protein n=1 Tax=Lewinella sp. 4G2 TaxID=1803372 RepID=UPI0018D2E19D|nr:DUF1015 family protein [Lewinella sp. 4G2]